MIELSRIVNSPGAKQTAAVQVAQDEADRLREIIAQQCTLLHKRGSMAA